MSNKLQCLSCGEILESKYRHDFQMCDCKNRTFIDGGDDYIRAGGADMDKIKLIPKDNSYLPEQG